jgi:hypothetical protein
MPIRFCSIKIILNSAIEAVGKLFVLMYGSMIGLQTALPIW